MNWWPHDGRRVGNLRVADFVATLYCSSVPASVPDPWDHRAWMACSGPVSIVERGRPGRPAPENSFLPRTMPLTNTFHISKCMTPDILVIH